MRDRGLRYDERGQATVEFALSFVMLAAFLLFAGMVADCAHAKVVADQALRVAARAAVYSWDEEAERRAIEVWRSNPGLLPGPHKPPTVEIVNWPNKGLAGILRRLNQPCDVTVTCHVPVPLLAGSVIFDRNDDFYIDVRSTCTINRWNAGVLFYVPVAVPDPEPEE